MIIQSIQIKGKIPSEVGLPKYGVNEVRVGFLGLDGDYNHYRSTRKNNTSNRAVLIMTEDMLKQLRDEGWPVKNGDLGDNFTISGLEYGSIKIGDKFKMGEIIIEITEKCNPCVNLEALPYVDEVDKFILLMRNRRGWYARVLREGLVTKGDAIERV